MTKMKAPSRFMKALLLSSALASLASVPIFRQGTSNALDYARQLTLSGNADDTSSGDDHDTATDEPLVFTPPPDERIVPEGDRMDASEIRFATFGSSHSWGAGIGDRRKRAYPFQLSLDPTKTANHAIRAGMPDYPAACLHSIMGDKAEYDVIILEYFMVMGDDVLTLSKRLKERFPDAVVILLKDWYPEMVSWHRDTDGEWESLRQWAKRAHGYGDHYDWIQRPELQEKFREVDGWFWNFVNNPNFMKRMEQVAREAGAYILEVPRPEDAKGLMDYIDRYAVDGFHPSEKGHTVIAGLIKKLVERIGVPAQPRMGKLLFTDSCHSWIQGGATIDHGTNIKFAQIPNTQKSALEFPQDRNARLIVENPSDGPQNILLTYMTTGPSPSKYPRAKVEIEGNPEVILDPNATDKFGDKAVHLQRTELVGTLPPGMSDVWITVLEKTEYPFRVTAVAVTNGAAWRKD